jgi:tetratricopeptide (TPR) repeat protein
VITLGTVEIAGGSSVAKATQNLRSYLEEHPLAHLSLESVEIEGLGHNYSPKMAFFYGLATIFADLTPPAEILEGGLSAIDAYYTTLAERYHAEMSVPEDIYSRLGWRLFEAGQEHEAGEVFRRWAERHPDSALAQASLGSFCRETGDTERAVRLLRKAIDLEERSQSPRLAFVHDLRRDINALEGRDPE